MTEQPKTLVLAIDDDEAMRNLVSSELTAQGFEVVTSDGSGDVAALVEELQPDIALIDVLMPGNNGFEVARRIHKQRPIPFVFVTGCDRRSDRVRGLEFGATDYVVKPFDTDELGSRIRAVLRRIRARDESTVQTVGDLDIDMNARMVRKDGEMVNFSRNEWKLFQFFATHQNRVLLSGDILAGVWGEEYREENQYLRVWISRIRAKIERDAANPAMLKTHPGVGYIFVTEGMEQEEAEPSLSMAGA